MAGLKVYINVMQNQNTQWTPQERAPMFIRLVIIWGGCLIIYQWLRIECLNLHLKMSKKIIVIEKSILQDLITRLLKSIDSNFPYRLVI